MGWSGLMSGKWLVCIGVLVGLDGCVFGVVMIVSIVVLVIAICVDS